MVNIYSLRANLKSQWNRSLTRVEIGFIALVSVKFKS